MASTEVAAPAGAMKADINVRAIRTMYRYLEHELSREDAEKFLRAVGLGAAYLENENNWVDYRLYMKAWQAVGEQTSDPAIGTKIGHFVISRQNLGSIWPLLRAAGLLGGGTAAAYRFIPRVTNQFSRAGRFTVESSSRRGVRLSWKQAPGYAFHPVQCEYRRGLLTAGPRLADLPPAAVSDARCIGRGDGECLYEVRFIADRATAGRRWGAILGASGAAAMLLAGGGWELAALLFIAAGAVGYARDSANQLAFNTSVISGQLEELVEAKLRLQEDYDTLQRTQQQLREKERLASLGELSARVAHELRNPLGIIKGSAQVLADPSKPIAVRSEMTSFILEEADRMNAAITNFLVFARPKGSQRTPADVGALIERLLLEWSARGEGAAEVRFSQRGGPARVLVDPHQLHQVLLNLLLNASEAVGGKGTIEIEAERQADGLRLAVIDDGPGFSEEAQDRAFEPFFTTKRYGTGLGLTNVKQMIEANGGEVEVGPRVEGRGARVSLRLEIAPPGA